MRKIYKYPTQHTAKFSIKMPKGAEILCVQIDEKTDDPCIWALVDPSNPDEYRDFELFGTGHEIFYDMGIERKYIGTFQLAKGSFVGHIFERIH